MSWNGKLQYGNGADMVEQTFDSVPPKVLTSESVNKTTEKIRDDLTSHEIINEEELLKSIKLRYLANTVREFSEGLAVVETGAGDFYVDREGNRISDKIYEFAYSFKNGFAEVSEKIGQWHCDFIINKNEKPVQSDFETDLTTDSVGLIDNLPSGERWADPSYYVDMSGDPIPNTLGYICLDNPFNEGYAVVEDGNTHKKIFIDKAGNLAFEGQFDAAESFEDGRAKVQLNGRCFYINNRGENILGGDFEELSSFDDKGFAIAKDKGKSFFIRENGTCLGGYTFDQVRPFSSDIAVVRINDEWSFINREGVLSSERFKYLDDFKSGLAHASNGPSEDNMREYEQKRAAGERVVHYPANSFFLIDTSGQRVGSLEFKSLTSFSNDRAIAVLDRGGQSVLVNQQGEALGETYDEIKEFTNGTDVFYLAGENPDVNNRYFLIDEMGKRLGSESISCNYGIKVKGGYGLFRKSVAGKSNSIEMFLDKQGKRVGPYFDEAMSFFTEGIANVEKDGKFYDLKVDGEVTESTSEKVYSSISRAPE